MITGRNRRKKIFFKVHFSKKAKMAEKKRPHNLELPRLYPHTHSTCKRPRRNQDGKPQIPERYWGSTYFCIEYPNGIWIDRNGIPQPNSKRSNRVAIEYYSDDTSEVSEYVPSSESETSESDAELVNVELSDVTSNPTVMQETAPEVEAEAPKVEAEANAQEISVTANAPEVDAKDQ